MRFVYVLEDDPKFQKEICEAIVFIDPKIQIRLFQKLEQFSDWIRLMMTEGAAAIPRAGVVPEVVPQEPLAEEEHKLVLVISKIEYLGVKQLNLLRKTRDLFIKRKICTLEDPTSIVLTAFEDPDFKIHDLEDRILNNILFKPLDRLILIQHLTFAIDGRHPPSKFTIMNQKTSAVFEMLKEVPLEALSEFGFVTRSNRKIDVGSIAKYYGSAFITERHRSVLGVCDACEPHPSYPQEFQIAVRFFAMDPTQISNLRKKIKAPSAKLFNYQWPLPPPPRGDEFHVVVIDPEESDPSGIGGTLERKFEGLKVTHYNSFKEFFLDVDPSQMNNKDEAPPKAFSTTGEVSFIFDPPTASLVGIEREDKTQLELFGMSEKDFMNKGQWFINHMNEAHRDKFRRLFREKNSIPADPFFLISLEGQNYLLVMIINDVLQSGKLRLKFTDASKEDWIKYLQHNSRCPRNLAAIFVSHRFLGENPSERWQMILDKLEKSGRAKPKVFLLTAKAHSDAEERELSTVLLDIFFKPVDRHYLALKFHYFFPTLKVLNEPLSLRTVSENESLRAANPVKISEISEAGFVMQYYRPISIGSFREMLLWQPYEIGAPILLSNCNFTEEVQGKKGEYNCHFVFFGMTDHFLKNIRVWIRDNYILSKENS